MFTYFPYSLISWNFLALFHFPKITRKQSGFPGIQEISFKVETLTNTITNKICFMEWFTVHHVIDLKRSVGLFFLD